MQRISDVFDVSVCAWHIFPIISQIIWKSKPSNCAKLLFNILWRPHHMAKEGDFIWIYIFFCAARVVIWNPYSSINCHFIIINWLYKTSFYHCWWFKFDQYLIMAFINLNYALVSLYGQLFTYPINANETSRQSLMIFIRIIRWKLGLFDFVIKWLTIKFNIWLIIHFATV